MRAEIIAVGTEMLMGQIVNTNAPFLAAQLNELGIDHYIETVIGDNPERLTQVTEQAEARSDVIIYSGGIGPTRDDLTKQTIAEHLNEPLVHDEKCLSDLTTWLNKRGREVTENQKRQALTFKNGQSFHNPVGLAVGTALHKNDHDYIFLPGFPKELMGMFTESVKPYLAERIHTDKVLTSEYYNYYAIGEADLAQQIDDLIDNQTNPTLAIYASKEAVTVRVTALGESEASNHEAIDRIGDILKKRLSNHFFSTGWKKNIPETLLEKLRDEHQTVGFAERLTGGLAAAKLAEIPGASSVLRGSLVCYDAEAKINVGRVDPNIIEQHGMVSEECAKKLAEGARQQLGSTLALSYTGVAGPDQMEGQPVGSVYVGLAVEGEETKVKHYQLHGSRNDIRERVINLSMFDLLHDTFNE